MRTIPQLNNRFKRAASMTISAVLLFLMLTSFSTGCSSTAFAVETASSTWISSAGSAVACAQPTLSAKAAVLMEASTGTVITATNADLRLPMASTTKIMTALVALEHMPIGTVITVDADAVGVEGSSIYLSAGETLTLEDLLYALLLESANDAAEAIAIAVAGDVPSFAALMNEYASQLGLTQTHFVNPHGLDDPEHYTTAHELALITRAALENETFRQICSTRRHTIPLHNTEGVRLLLNHNKLLGTYDGCIGVKTGFTKKTGRCLVSAAERDGLTLIAVTLGAPDDWHDHTALLDHGFSLYESITLCMPGDHCSPMPLIGGKQEYVLAENRDLCRISMRRDHGAIFCVTERRRFDFAPVECDDVIGRLVFYEETSNGKQILADVPLYAAYTVTKQTEERGFFARLWSRITEIFA